MPRLRFCNSCLHIYPVPNQQVFFVGGKTFCKTTCFAYLKAVKEKRDRESAQHTERYGKPERFDVV